jgi:hypothetical protein
MARLSALQDVGHYWGSDTQLTPTGDLARADNLARSQQRVLRRLMTNPGDYYWHPTYGAGLPAKIGQILDLAEIRAVIRTQMQLEASVSKADPIRVDVAQISDGVSVALAYTALPDRQPVTLSFDVSV